jgi:uncharacterized protein (DUF697 family)
VQCSGNADTLDVRAFFRTFVKFFGIFFGSIGLGSLLGAITALLTKERTRFFSDESNGKITF